MEKYYSERKAQAGPNQPVEFVTDEIRLDLPMEETKVNDMWTILPLIEPVVSDLYICIRIVNRKRDYFFPHVRMNVCMH